jgi:hypothetical protein
MHLQVETTVSEEPTAFSFGEHDVSTQKSIDVSVAV